MNTQSDKPHIGTGTLWVVSCLLLPFIGCATTKHTDTYTYTDINAQVLVAGNVERRLERVNSRYRLGVGDEIDTFVDAPFEPSNCTTSTIPPNGCLSFLCGIVYFVGRTPMEAEAAIHKAMKPLEPGYFAKVRADVVVVGFKSQKYTVTGEVNGAGEFPFDGDTSVVQAIARAKGVTSRAAWDRVRIVRTTPTGPQTIEINLADIVKGGRWDKNVPLCANDVIQVPAAGAARP